MLACGQQVSEKGQPKKTTNAPFNAKPTNHPFPPPRSGFVQQVAAANRHWRIQFRIRGSRHASAVAQLLSLGIIRTLPPLAALVVMAVDSMLRRANRAQAGIQRLHDQALVGAELSRVGIHLRRAYGGQVGLAFVHLAILWKA